MGLKKGVVSACLLAISVIGSIPINVRGEASEDRIQGNVDDLARAVLSCFPDVQGSVIALEGGRIHMDLGADTGITEGTLLSAYRKGRPFYHPDTGMALGQFEEEVGVIEVVSLRPGESEGRQTDPSPSVQVGDLVRIAEGRIPVAVTWVRFEAQRRAPEGAPPALISEFIAALSETRRFQITLLPPQSNLEAASAGHNLYLLQLSVSQANETGWIGFRMQNTKTGTSLSSMVVQTGPSSPSDSVLETLQYHLRQKIH